MNYNRLLLIYDHSIEASLNLYLNLLAFQYPNYNFKKHIRFILIILKCMIEVKLEADHTILSAHA